MKTQAVTKCERVNQPVPADIPVSNHLGLGHKFLVKPKERIVDQIAVISGDVCARPHRIQKAQDSMGHHLQRPGRLAGAPLRNSRPVCKDARQHQPGLTAVQQHDGTFLLRAIGLVEPTYRP